MNKKAMRFSMPTKPVEKVGESLVEQSVSTEDISGDGVAVSELILVSSVAPDPNQPRVDRITADEMMDGISPDDKHFDKKKAFRDRVIELSQTINSADLQQPIKVYRHGKGFRILAGERRYMAHLYLARERIHALVHHQPPKRLRLAQLVENSQKELLSAWDRVYGLDLVISEHEKLTGESPSLQELSELVGWTYEYVRLIMKIINGPKEVYEAIKNGSLSSIKIAASLAEIDDIKQRRHIMEQAIAGANAETVKGLKREAEEKQQPPEMPPKPKPRGRPTCTVKLGAVKKGSTVRYILERIRPDSDYDGIDWDDRKQVAGLWSKIIAEVEEELSE